MADNDIKSTEGTENGLSRREFVSGVGGIGLGAILGGLVVKGFILPEEVFAVPTSQGYLLVDTKKCAGCDTCMVSCSLVHTGRVNPSLSRIQITKNPFGGFPNDMEQIQCRQCPYPACVEVCPTGANHVEEKFGNVRMVDEAKCIGCERCVEACPFTPSRMQWNFEDKHAQKCDLCANTPFWDKDGGPTGKQACVESCPMRAISFTTEVPVQSEVGYMANLRNEHWGVLMLDTTELGREADWAPPGA
jgi:protein NrfC